MNNGQLTQLVEANEHLVKAMLQAHTQRGVYEKKIRDMTLSSDLDVLTHLPNRLILLDRVSHAIVNAKRSGDRLALLFINLNKFKYINDTLGHAAGDQVLKNAAHCLTSSVRESDTVSRHGGDEFVVLLEKVSDLSEVTLIVKKIFSALEAPNRVDDHMIRLTASVGISLYPDDGDDTDILLARADSAMHAAKRSESAGFVFAKAVKAEQRSNAGAAQVLPFEISSREKEHRLAYRRSADEQMVFATLAAQELQASAELALRRQTEFMVTLAHELRNPLGLISNAALIIGKASPESATTTKITALLDRQVTHMAKLMDDVFDMSRIATGKMRIECERIDIVTTIRQAVDGVQASIDARRQKLHCTLPNFAVEILGDPVRLVQIFTNLLDNASKYTPKEGSIELTLETNATSVVVSLKDTGIGITAEALPNVFEFFVQDTHAVRFNGRGLGIGLALVKDLVEAHHGTVTAHSDGASRGSRFTAAFPIAT